MDNFTFIKNKQIIWAKSKGIHLIGSKEPKGEKYYTEFLKYNLFKEISKNTYEEIFDGDGGELKDNISKMQALYSSSALCVNVFDYWSMQEDKSIIAKALCVPSVKITSINFEQKFPILDSSNKPPNIDIIINYSNNYITAIECKFTEPWQNRKSKESGMKEKYFSDNEIWHDLPNTYNLSKSISPIDTKFKYLHASQLIKHVLGLKCYIKRTQSKKDFRLVYLWYNVFGEESKVHSDEIDIIKETFQKDGIIFQSITWQEVICSLNKMEVKNNHKKYIKYITERYL